MIKGIQDKNRRGLRIFAACWSIVLAIGIASVASPAAAETFPSRAITLIVSVPPGGPLDSVARIVAPALSKAIGQSVVVENRPGASQKIGIQSLLHAPKDGYTIAVVSPASMTINPLIDKTIGYDPVKDFTYLTQAVSLYYVLVANPSLPVKSVPELVSYVKAHPDKLAYSAGGVGTLTHFETQKLLQRLGISILPVQYKGDGPALMAVLGNQVQLMVAGTGSATPFIKQGKLVALATTGPARTASLPNVPTYRETGIKSLENFTTLSWIGFVAAAGIPAEATKKLNDALVAALHDPKVKQNFEASGYTVVASTPSEFADMVHTTLEGNRKVIESGALNTK